MFDTPELNGFLFFKVQHVFYILRLLKLKMGEFMRQSNSILLCLLVFLFASTSNADCILKKNREAAESACDEAKKTGLYSETKVSMVCGDVGVVWTKLKEFGSCACCVKRKESNQFSGLLSKSCILNHQAAASKLTQSQPYYWDKFGHCAVSCILAYRCGKTASLSAGHAKEIEDLFDKYYFNSYRSGDLSADKRGIQFFKSGANSDEQCMSSCKDAYPLPPVIPGSVLIKDKFKERTNEIKNDFKSKFNRNQ